jgi:streptogramin lyase
MRRAGALFFIVFTFVAAISATAQAAHWRYTLRGTGSRATALVAGPERAVWFIATGDFERHLNEMVLGKVTAGGQVTEIQLSAQLPSVKEMGRVQTIVADSDGNLWFGEQEGIGRRTAVGEINSFPLPTDASTPTGMAVGPDGNVWFTEGAASKIGRITPSGQFTQFPLPPDRQPSGIAAGPDGNLWFTERAANAIGQITPSGKIAEFQVPGGQELELNSIAAGPDGNLWFGEEGAPQVGRITPGGVVTHFAVPGGDGTRAVISGPGGLLWFASKFKIGAISPSGASSWPLSCPFGCSSEPETLALGPEGRLWTASGITQCVDLCGGGTAIGLARQPGQVKPYSLPPLQLGPGIAPIRRGRTSLTVACGLEQECAGTLRLGRYVVRNRKSRFQALSQADYELRQGERKRISLPISRKIATLLHKQKPKLIAMAGDEPGPVARRFGLRIPR